MDTEVEIKQCDHKPKNARASRNWKRQWTDSFLEPPEGGWSCHLEFGFLVSRTVREYISVVSSPPDCCSLLDQPQEMKAPAMIITSLLVLLVIQVSA